MKKIKNYIIAIVILAIFFGTFSYLFKQSRPEVISYEELSVETRDINRTAVVTGQIIPRNEVNIKPQINGIISELYKEAGQHVSEGEVIAKVKVIPEMSSLSSAESRLRLSELNLKQAERNYEREKSLHDKNLVSQEEFDNVSQQYAQAKEEYKAANDALEVIRDGVSKSNASSSSTLIRSTISGLILDIPIKVGNSVIQANTMNDGTTIATVANMNDLIFDGNVDETEVGRLSEGMPVTITIGALQNLSFDATLEYISPKATNSGGANQFEIKAAVSVPDGSKVRSGYSANAEIVLQSVKDVPSISETALMFKGDSVFVQKVSAKGYQRVPVQTGLSDGVNVEIVSGLSVGDKVRGARIVE